MALTITHTFVSGKTDGNDTSLVRPSNWNASHTISGTVDESMLAFTDVTTANVSIANHGLTPKLSNNAGQYLDGTGAWSSPAGDGGVSLSTSNLWTDINRFSDHLQVGTFPSCDNALMTVYEILSSSTYSSMVDIVATSSGDMSDMTSMVLLAQAQGNVSDKLTALYVRNDIDSGTTSQSAGIWIDGPGVGGSVTTTYGLLISPQTGGNAFNLYSAGGASVNVFDGAIGMGTSTPKQALSVIGGISNVPLQQTGMDDTSPMTLLGTIPVGTIGAGSPSDVFVSGNYLYTANIGDGSFSVIDITVPTAPVQVGNVVLGSTNSGAFYVYVYGTLAYIACFSGGFFVVDVTNPTTPTIINAQGTSSGPTDIIVSGRYAYVPCGTNGHLEIYDVANPASTIALTGTLTLPTTSLWCLDIQDQFAYVTDSSGFLYVVNISNPTSPSLAATLAVPGNPCHITISGRYAYISLTGELASLQIVDISNPLIPVLTATAGPSQNGEESPNFVTVAGRYAFVTNTGSSTILVIDIAFPFTPVLVTTLGNDNGCMGVAVSGRNLFTTNLANSTLGIYDIGGLETISITAHSAKLGLVQILNNAVVEGELQVGRSLSVVGGIGSLGDVTVRGNLNCTGAVMVNGAAVVATSWTEGSSVVTTTDNVGIGITTPTVPLHVSHDTTSNTQGIGIRLNAVSGGAGAGLGILWTDNADVLQMAMISGQDDDNWGGRLVFMTSPQTNASPGGTPTERMRIDSVGKVGINTATYGEPQAYFHLNCSTHHTGIPTFLITNSQYEQTILGIADKGLVQINSYDDYSNAGPALTVTQNGANAGSGLTVIQNGMGGNAGSALIVTQNNSAKPAMTVAGGSVTMTGGVIGLGTSSPDVHSAVDIDGYHQFYTTPLSVPATPSAVVTGLVQSTVYTYNITRVVGSLYSAPSSVAVIEGADTLDNDNYITITGPNDGNTYIVTRVSTTNPSIPTGILGTLSSGVYVDNNPDTPSGSGASGPSPFLNDRSTGLIINTLSGGRSLYCPTDGVGLILGGHGGYVDAELRIVGQGGAWVDGITTSYFQVQNSINNALTIQGGTSGHDVKLDRLQILSGHTSFSDGAYTTTPVPTALLEVWSSVGGFDLQRWLAPNATVLASVSTSGNLGSITKTSAINSGSGDGTVAFDVSQGDLQTYTFAGASVTASIVNIRAGQTITFVITQDSTGGWTFTWPGNVQGGLPVNTAANSTTTQQFTCVDGTNLYAIGSAPALTLTSGTGINVTGTGYDLTISNTAPTVSVAAGAGISVSPSGSTYTVSSGPETIQSLSPNISHAIDWSQGSIAVIPMNGDMSLSQTNAVPGVIYTVIIQQGNGNDVTWDGSFKGASPIDIFHANTVFAHTVNIQRFICYDNSGNIYAIAPATLGM